MYLQELITEKKIKHPGLHSLKPKFQVEVLSTKRCTFVNRSFIVYGQNYGILFPTVSKKVQELTHLRENSKQTCSQKLTTKKLLVPHIKCLS